MKTKYLWIGAPVLGLVAGVVVTACASDPPHLDSVVIQTTSETHGTGLTYVRDATNPTVVYADPTKGVYFGNGLSVVLGTSRSISNLPDSDADKNKLLLGNFTLSVQGDCVSTGLVIGNSDQVIINTVHDGDCQVTFAVNGAHGVIVMPVHVVDQGSVPADVYPADLPPPDAGDDGAADASTSDEASVQSTDDGGSDAGDDGGTGIAPVGGH